MRLAALMSKLYMLALSLLASCVGSATQLETRSIVPIQQAAIAIRSTVPMDQELGDSLLRFGIGGTPVALVLGYGAINAESDGVLEGAAVGLGTARPYVGFSLSF